MMRRRILTGVENNSTSAVVNYLGKSESLPRRRFCVEARGVNLRPAGIIHWCKVWHDVGWSMSWAARLPQNWRDLKPRMAAGKGCHGIRMAQMYGCLVNPYCMPFVCWMQSAFPIPTVEPVENNTGKRTSQNTPKHSTTTACKRIAVERKTSREPVKETPNMDSCLVIHDWFAGNDKYNPWNKQVAPSFCIQRPPSGTALWHCKPIPRHGDMHRNINGLIFAH